MILLEHLKRNTKFVEYLEGAGVVLTGSGVDKWCAAQTTGNWNGNSKSKQTPKSFLLETTTVHRCQAAGICFLSKLTPSTRTYSLKVTMNNAVIQSVTVSVVDLFTALFLTMFSLKRTLCGCKEKCCDWWLYETLPACTVVVLLLCGPNLSEVLETDMLTLFKKIWWMNLCLNLCFLVE